MLKRSTLILSLFALLAGPVAAIELEIDDEGLTREAETIEDDYLFLGRTLIFDGQAQDLYLAGASITVNGRALAGITAFGESVEINGSAGNDAILGGNRVQIDGAIEGTVFVGANTFVLTQDAVIDGDLFIGSSNARLQGTVNGNVWVGSGTLLIAGTINGNVAAGVGEIEFTETGRINGNFYYTSEDELAEADRGKISGTITQERDRPFGVEGVETFGTFMRVAGIILFIVSSLSLLILGLLLLLLPLFKDLPQRNGHKEFWFSALWGLIPFFLYPVAIILFMVLVITIPLGFFLLLAALPVLVLTLIIGIKFTGDYLFALFGWKNANRFVRFLLGFAVFFILGLIPIIKILSFILFSSLGWGFIIEKLFKKKLVAGDSSTEKYHS